MKSTLFLYDSYYSVSFRKVRRYRMLNVEGQTMALQSLKQNVTLA